MTEARDIVAEIASAIPERHGPLPWWQRVAGEHQDTLRAIHAAWKAGTFGTRRMTAARAIANRIRDEFGIDIREQGVIKWLDLPTY